jgi:hypothetical protein
MACSWETALKRRKPEQPTGFYRDKATDEPSVSGNPAREDARPTQDGFDQQTIKNAPPGKGSHFSLDRARCPDTLAAMRMGKTRFPLGRATSKLEAHHPKNPGI